MPAISLLNPVQQLAKRLTSFDISDEILTQATEKLRILDVKVATGTLGNRIDRQETRAAIILEHVYRQQTKERIPHDVLAKAAGVKPNKLRELQAVLMSYLQPIQYTSSTSRNTKVAASAGRISTSSSSLSASRPPTSDGYKVDRATINTESQHSPATTILPGLAIRLASKVTDPHGCAQAAQQLLHNIHKHVDNSTSHTTIGQLHDLQRFSVAYEAAAFYYYATRQQQHAKGSRKKPASRDSETDLLKLADLEAASSDIILSEVKQTLPKIETWIQMLEEHKEETNGADYKYE